MISLLIVLGPPRCSVPLVLTTDVYVNICDIQGKGWVAKLQQTMIDQGHTGHQQWNATLSTLC